jgi:hypothetical protein
MTEKDNSIEEFVHRTPPTLQGLVGKRVTAKRITGGLPTEITVRQAWHRYGAPMEACMRATSEEGIFTARVVDLFLEIHKVDKGDAAYASEEFQKSVSKIATNAYSVNK